MMPRIICKTTTQCKHTINIKSNVACACTGSNISITLIVKDVLVKKINPQNSHKNKKKYLSFNLVDFQFTFQLSISLVMKDNTK